MGQAIINGLVSGLLVALPAIALSMSYGVLNFPNFAIGAMITCGAYFAYYFNVDLSLHILMAGTLAAAAMAVVAVAAHKVVYRSIGSDDHITLLVGSMGVAFVLENVVRFIYGAEVRTLNLPVARPLIWNDLRFNREQFIIAIVASAAMLAVALLLKRTALGRAMRAVSDNPQLADVRGIHRQRVITWTWAVSGALAAVAGLLIAMDTTVEPMIGANYLVSVFAAAIVGGIGNPFGAMAGGLIIGLVEEISTLALPTTYRQGVSFLVLALVLFLRPNGLFGAARIRR